MPHALRPHKSYEHIFLTLILATAIYFRLFNLVDAPPGLFSDEAVNGNSAVSAIDSGDYKVFYPENNGREGLYMNVAAVSIKLFGHTASAIRFTSVLFGVLTVLGTYLLARKLFDNWQIAAIIAFLLAISFWHVLFSRLAFRAIMAPAFMVWSVYFYWRGKSHASLFNFAMSGILLGLGFYSYISFRVMPLVFVLVFIAYWHSSSKHFDKAKYAHIKGKIIRGAAILVVATIIVALPLGFYYLMNPVDFMGRLSQVSVLSSDNILLNGAWSTIKTAGMFNVYGDFNWRHNLAGSPQLLWPVGILFIVGFIRGLIRSVKRWRSHGHLPTIYVLLYSWFGLGLLPVVLSVEGVPHALRAVMVIPVVYIFAGEALWWLFVSVDKLYSQKDMHVVKIHGDSYNESKVVSVAVLLVFLVSLAGVQYYKYFEVWNKQPETEAAYNKQTFDFATSIIPVLPFEEPRYVLILKSHDNVERLPIESNIVMYLTDTFSTLKQKNQNLYYITKQQFDSGIYTDREVLIHSLP